MGLWANLFGTFSQTFQIQKGGSLFKNNAGVLEAKTVGDGTLASFNASSLIAGSASVVGSLIAFGDANKVTFQYASGQSANTTYTWVKPDNGKFLTTDGSGNLSWAVPAEPTVPTDIVHVASKVVAFGASSPVNHKLVPIGAIVTKVQVIIDTAFDTAATLSVGKAGTIAKYMATTENDLQGVAGSIYEAVYGNAAITGSDEQVIVTYTANSATVGSARVLVYYVSPEVL